MSAAVQGSAAPHASLEIKSRYETIFSIFLLALGFLFRSHASITYPQILYVFGFFLAFNLLFNRYLKQKVQSSPLAFSPVFVNGILITWAVLYSGGPDSYLWVMYLLPVFASCLLHDGRRVTLSTLYVLALHALVYGRALWDLDGVDGLQFFGRSALLILSAYVTARLAAAERSVKASALTERRSYEESLARLWGGAGVENGAASLTAVGVHDVNTALGIILGSSQLVLSQIGGDPHLREDLARIDSSVRLGKIILQNLYLLGEPDADWPRQKGSIHEVLEEAVEQCRGEVRSKQIRVETALSAADQEAFMNARLLGQAFANLLFAAVASTPAGGRVRLSTRAAEAKGSLEVVLEDQGGRMEEEARRRFFDPRWAAPGRGKGMGLGLYLGREILLRHGAEVQVMPSENQGNRVVVRFPLDGEGGSPIRLRGLKETLT